MPRLEARPQPSRLMFYATPLIAILFTLAAGGVLFALLKKPPLEALALIFIRPLTSVRGLAELTVKAAPLILIAIGLAAGFRAGVWNIGAEGQYTVGALAGGSLALAVYPVTGWWLLPLMSLAGIIGGAAWAAIPALLRSRFNANEILVSLMLNYVAVFLLGSLVHGPLRDPDGLNFPESRLFQTALPLIVPGTRAHVGFVVALIAALVAWVLMEWHLLGFQIKVLGQAPGAARFAGFSEPRLVWLCFLVSGGCAGLAGLFEATGPVGQLVPALPAGYGFTGIIVAFLGRLHPAGIVLAGLLMALTYIGGETAQISMSLPSAATAVFQGMFLFFLLASDLLVNYRVRWRSHTQPAPAGHTVPDMALPRSTSAQPSAQPGE
ncbi:MAG: ABC transporter permease [Hyphomicrobiaceae bacterium]|nr:ABC transporter permease [Hyphomicrobiaceae bacterium]